MLREYKAHLCLGPFGLGVNWVQVLELRVWGFGFRFSPEDSSIQLYNQVHCRSEAKVLRTCRECTWVVVRIMVPFSVPILIWHLLFRVPKKGP